MYTNSLEYSKIIFCKLCKHILSQGTLQLNSWVLPHNHKSRDILLVIICSFNRNNLLHIKLYLIALLSSPYMSSSKLHARVGLDRLTMTDAVHCLSINKPRLLFVIVL